MKGMCPRLWKRRHACPHVNMDAGPLDQRRGAEVGAMMAAPYNRWVSGARAQVTRLIHP